MGLQHGAAAKYVATASVAISADGSGREDGTGAGRSCGGDGWEDFGSGEVGSGSITSGLDLFGGPDWIASDRDSEIRSSEPLDHGAVQGAWSGERASGAVDNREWLDTWSRDR